MASGALLTFHDMPGKIILRWQKRRGAQCRQHFDEAMLIEMTQLIGLYVGVAMQVALIRPAFDTYTSSEPILARPQQAI